MGETEENEDLQILGGNTKTSEGGNTPTQEGISTPAFVMSFVPLK